MRPFDYEAPQDAIAAVRLAMAGDAAHVEAPAQFLGGGTTLLDLMKLGVMRPSRLVAVTGIAERPMRQIVRTDAGLHIGALVSMAELAGDAQLRRDYPLIYDTLWQAASPQLRVMARLGGNVLQRTRCPYFRDTSYAQCNKRDPGSGCAALDGFNRSHAVLGTSKACIATYAGDWAHALIALDAGVEVLAAGGTRTIPFARLHRLPQDTPQVETTLRAGELITGFTIPGGPWPRSAYVKVRDRASYSFALAGAAVALDLDGSRVRDVRIALSGVATVPWRARKAEARLRGRTLDEAAARDAAAAEFADAEVREHNAFKVPLGQETVVRALLQAQAREV